MRKLAVVACMDARLDPLRLLGLAEGDAHVIRNGRPVVTDDVIRSLTISQRLLGTTEIVLIHHTDCGMLRFRDDAVKDEVPKDTGTQAAVALEAFQDLDEDVRQSMRRIEVQSVHSQERGRPRLRIRREERQASRGRLELWG